VALEALPLLALLAIAQARAAEAMSTPPSGPTEPLMVYNGEESAIRYTPGALDRAVHVARRLDLIIAEMRKPLGVVLPITAIVLSREEWERKGLERTYGLPQPLSVGTIALPAAGDAGTVNKWKTWLGTGLPDIGGVPMVGTRDDASSLMLSDLLMQVEVCELILDRTPVAAAEPWIRGLLSQLAALTLWSDFEPSRVPEIDHVWASLRGQLPPLLALEQRRIEAGQPPLRMEHWLLAESYLFDGAARALASGKKSGDGVKSFRKLLKTMVKDAKPPTRDELVALFPVLVEWLDSLPTGAGVS
jgi:hypothetical protein